MKRIWRPSQEYSKGASMYEEFDESRSEKCVGKNRDKWKIASHSGRQRPTYGSMLHGKKEILCV
jgi:hypothetical protein